MGSLVRSTRVRWLTTILLILVVVVAIVAVAVAQIANPRSYLSLSISRSGEARYGADGPLTDLTAIDQLQAAFNRDAGHPRLLLLLSPT